MKTLLKVILLLGVLLGLLAWSQREHLGAFAHPAVLCGQRGTVPAVMSCSAR